MQTFSEGPHPKPSLPHPQHPQADIPTYIVQAGGQGARMEHYTWNKPKCLLPIDGKPLLYHQLALTPQAHYIIIGDYQFEVLEAYLKAFPPGGHITLIHGHTHGTCAGMAEALEHVDQPDKPIGILWCDLLLDHMPEVTPGNKPVLGLSGHFPCRWSLAENGELKEEMSFDRGIAGYFVFPNASFLHHIPRSGEFVRWLNSRFHDFDAVQLDDCEEVGNLSMATRHWETRGYARFFNDVHMLPQTVEKRGRTPEGEERINGEADWYAAAAERGFTAIPRVLGRSPLTMERIHGAHPDELKLKPLQKYNQLNKIFGVLDKLHACGTATAAPEDCSNVYIRKTLQRVEKIHALIPHGHSPQFHINGMLCQNPFSDPATATTALQAGAEAYLSPENFTFIHGDPTFANTLVDAEGGIFLIDPRTSFGKSRFFSDADYDWAKLCYSALGDYDAFNRRRFRLVVWNETITLDIDSAGFAFTRDLFRERLGEARLRKVEWLHAMIWLSLAGWVDDDVDSIMAAFFNGIYWLQRWKNA